MKVLITGASGFVGSRMVIEALARGHAVRALVREGKDVSRLSKQKVEIVSGDIANAASLPRAVDGINAVIHCAAATSAVKFGYSESYRVNVEGTRNLLEAAKKAGRPRWIQISTMSAHEGIESSYGRTKLEADQVVRASGLAWTILRPSLVYDSVNEASSRGLVAKTLRIIRRLPVIPVIGPGTGTIRPIHVADVARAAFACLTLPTTEEKSYKLGGPDEVTLNEFLSRLAAAAGIRKRLFHIPLVLALTLAKILEKLTAAPPITVDNVLGAMNTPRVDIQPSIEDFGFNPIGLEEGLRRGSRGEG